MRTAADIVLIVDDDEGQRELAEMICKQMNLKTHSCVDAVAARKWLESNAPRLILLDIMMPDGNGVDFCRWIRSQEDLKASPVIVTSALKEAETIQDAFEAGAVDFLPKPFDLALFKEKVERRIQMGAPPQG